jgi:TolB-like protein/DNA-binding winged helix-turn-helix (wHTH) protein
MLRKATEEKQELIGSHMSLGNGPPRMSRMYRFGEFLLDPWRHTLSRADSPIFLTPKAFDLLVYLVQNPNRLVSKEELLRAVWQDTFVEEGNLTQYVSHLRKALGDNAEDARWIVTIARKGYEFAGDVVFSDEADPARRAAGQVPVSVGLQTYAPPASDVPKTGVAANRPRPGRTSVVVASSIFMLALAAYLSWHHFRAPALPETDKIRLAVLPFENLTGDPNKEYLADGLTEEMISQLGRLNPQQLRVIARTSVMGYKHSDVRLDQIGRDLSVQYVLENSLRESGDHMRLTAQLIQMTDQTHLWSQDYDYPVKDILIVEDAVAKAVAHEVQLRLSSQQQADLSRSSPVNPEAFDAYLQGYYFFERDTGKDAQMAAKYYERATQLDPSYALAWVGLSRARNWQVNIGLIPAEEGRRLAREEVERALTLNPKLVEAYVQMGRIKQQVDLDWLGADASFQRAVELEPENPETLRTAASSAEMLGRFDEALQLDGRAIELDPLNAESWEFRGETEFSMGQLDEAAADSKKALELNPDVWPGPILLSQIYVVQGHPQNALAEIKLVRYDRARMFLYAVAYYALGRQKEADAALSELIAKYHSRNAYQIAQVYAFRKQSDEGFKWLDQAYAQRDSGLIGTNVDPLLKNLHNDPRFAAFLKKIRLPN